MTHYTNIIDEQPIQNLETRSWLYFYSNVGQFFSAVTCNSLQCSFTNLNSAHSENSDFLPETFLGGKR